MPNTKQKQAAQAKTIVHNAIDALAHVIDQVLPEIIVSAEWHRDNAPYERDRYGSYEDQHRLRTWELV